VFRGDFVDALERLRKAERRMRRLPTVAYNRAPLEALVCWALYFKGELSELGRRVDQGLRDALERGDRLRESSLSSGFCNMVWLFRDDPDGARVKVERALALWPETPFQTQHFFALLAHCHIDLYVEEGASALARLEQVWQRIQHARLLKVPLFTAALLHARARAHLLAARHQPSHRKLALQDCARIEALGAPWAEALAGSLRAAMAPAKERSLRLLEAAADCDQHAMSLLAAACRFRAGEDPQHGLEREQARGWLDGEGVRAPGRLVRLFLPNWEPSS
jgi:hypothetical protein